MSLLHTSQFSMATGSMLFPSTLQLLTVSSVAGAGFQIGETINGAYPSKILEIDITGAEGTLLVIGHNLLAGSPDYIPYSTSLTGGVSGTTATVDSVVDNANDPQLLARTGNVVEVKNTDATNDLLVASPSQITVAADATDLGWVMAPGEGFTFRGGPSSGVIVNNSGSAIIVCASVWRLNL